MRTFFGLILLLLCMPIALAISQTKRAWRSISDPAIMSDTFNKNFNFLPLQGKIADPKKLWSSDYWALYKGNINYRWNAARPRGFGLVSPTKNQAMSMTQEQLAALAPSEKFDLLNGNYDYPLKKEVARRTSPRLPTWEGICNGWAPAALNHDEPLPITLANPDGIQIPFGSSDVKALLSYYYAYKYSPDSTHQMGYRCKEIEDDFIDSDACYEDLNAGAYHIVLTNKVGIEGGSFIAEIDPGEEVWNHPVWDYQSTIVTDNLRPRDSAPGTVKRVRIKTRMAYVYEIKKNSWTPVLGTDGQVVRQKYYEYTLDINKDGIIIGGNWISRDRPDFLWTMKKTDDFGEMFAKLPLLLQN